MAATLFEALSPLPAKAEQRRLVPALYIVVVLVSLLTAFAYQLRVNGIFACTSAGYSPDTYLADCWARAYGDFDHGAFWYGLDAPSRDAVTEAQVLFLGNSRMQFALSGEPALAWARSASVRHYLFGFSHNETVRFYVPLLEKIEPRARAYVINVDRFFDDRLSFLSAPILFDSETVNRYRNKHRWQAPHWKICSVMPLICGNAPVIFRERRTGSWTMHGQGDFVESETSVAETNDVSRWPEYIRHAENFIAGLPVSRECIVLTLVPTLNGRLTEADAIADAVGVPLVVPTIGGLRTFDSSHLDAASADRWAAAFFEMAGPRLARCANGPVG